MVTARRRLLYAAPLLLVALIGRAADAPPAGDGKMPREPEPPVAPEEKTVTLPLKEYQDLLNRARGDVPAKPEAPSTCRVTGHVAGDLAQLVVEFEFHTDGRRTRVVLASGQAYPTEAKIDGRAPLLRWGTDGLSVLVDEAGDHQVVLKMDLPLTARDRGAGRGLDLDLPAAVTTTLDLALPAGVKKALARTTVRGEGVPGRPPAAREHRADANGRLTTSGLGPVERLELSWEAELPAAGPPLLSVIASRVFVSMDEHNIATRAEITVGVRRGQLKDVQLRVPPQAVVRRAEGDGRVSEIGPATGELRTIRLKPTSDPLTLTVDVTQANAGARVPIGPFVVLGAFPQGGDIIVTAPADRSLGYHARGESQYLLTQREPTEEEKRKYANLLALHYSTLPGAEKPLPVPFLELEASRRAGALEARVQHALRLVRGEEGRPAVWRLLTTIEAQDRNAEIDHVTVEMPAGFTLDEGSATVQPGEVQARPAQGRQVDFVLTPHRKDKFALTFEGQYAEGATPSADTGQCALGLPVVVGKKLDRGAVVSVALPPDLELVAPPGAPLWDDRKPEAHNKRTWPAFDRWPERFEVAWRPYRPALIVEAEVRLKLLGRQASVIHRLWLAPGQAVPELQLAVPSELLAFSVQEGGPLREGKDGTRALPFASPPDREHPAVLQYSFATPERGAEPLNVPLVWPRNATGGETRVFVWTDPGARAEWKAGPWEVRLTEGVKDEPAYPSLVLRSRQPGAPLALALGEAAGVPLAAFRVEKGLVQAAVDGSQQSYRARFLLSQIAARAIDVTLPQRLFRPNANAAEVSVLLAGKVAAWKPVDDAGRDLGASTTARVQVPADLLGKSAVLEVDYSLLPGGSPWRTELLAPMLRGDPGVAQVRWQVALPPSWVPLSSDAVSTEDYGWRRRGWFFALRPTVANGDLEEWFAGRGAALADAGRYADPAIVAWRSAPEPVRLTHVPEQAWLLVCSLTLLIVGLSLAFLSLPRACFWGTLALLGVGALLAGLLWPGVLAAILYGSQPGVLVLLPVLGVQWLMHQRYRRQVVFLPGFQRMKTTGSSLVRGSSSRSRGEPSTVDATPPAAPGSKKSQADGSVGK
jgi:hypothetical protein